MHETDLTNVPPADLAAAFNTVYTDYVIPFTVGEAWARQHLAANGIAPEGSILWRDDAGATVGLALLGVRGERGWVGGFGIAPDYRGQGLSHRLIGATLDRARRLGLRRVQLEVITTNSRAIAVYERAGFARTRDLLILARPADVPAPAADPGAAWEAEPAALWPHAARLDMPAPPWQREPESLAAIPDLRGLAVGVPASPEAFLVYRAGEAGASILTIAGASPDALATLVGALVARLPGRALSLANEPEESAAPGALLGAGWRETLRQHEMVCAL
jgi:ribosomal protein S18 acetylase RimI-like enzyme